MASAYKILGQAVASIEDLETTLSINPSTGKNYIVSSLNVSAPKDGTNYVGPITVHVLPVGSSPAPSNAILYNIPIEADTSVSFTLGITLGPGEQLIGRTDSLMPVTFTAFGEEITV